MTTVLLALAVAVQAQSEPKKRQPLVCADAASIRGFKAAVVEDSGWEHALADEWARCACPKEADAAGWPEPRPALPEKWRGALPALRPGQHAANVQRLAKDFILFHQRPLPVTPEQAEAIADCWIKRREAVLKARKKASPTKS